MKCILVDDEALALLRLENLLAELNENVEIVQKCSNGVEAIQQINMYRPDVVFLDIKMPEVDGFAVVEGLSYEPIIIFTTAFDEHALKAFQVKALRYLLKPIKRDELKEAISFIETKMVHQSKKKTIIVKEMGKQLVLPIDKIELISTSNRIVFIHFEGKKIIADKGMDEYESILPKSDFFRTHRSFIVNINFVEQVQNNSSGKKIITTLSGNEASLSRDRIKSFEKVLK